MKKLHVCFWASLAALLMLAAVPAAAADVKELFAIDLPDSPGKEGRMIEVSYPPGARDMVHRHDAHAFVYVLEGELTLIEDGGETVLRAGDCAAFPKGSGNGHHLINKSGAMAVYLEVGARSPADVTICSDIDMMSTNADGRFVHKDGTPYPEA